MDAGKRDGWNISLKAQPANSPDLNVLDLGYFASIQALQQTKQMATIDELIAAVNVSYYEIDRIKLDNVFLTLMTVMEQCLLQRGGNNYSIPHVKKDQRRRNGEALVTLQCSSVAVDTGSLARYLHVLVELL